jgi:hypothetical protein
VVITLDGSGAVTERSIVADGDTGWGHGCQQHGQFHEPHDDQPASPCHLVPGEPSL